LHQAYSLAFFLTEQGTNMTRKDFQLIADVLTNFNVDNVANQRDVTAMIAEAFAKELKQTNPRFNKALFLKACSVQ